MVASPQPKRIFEIRPIQWLLDKDVVVICAGGGGIPTMYGPAGERSLVGVEAVHVGLDFLRASVGGAVIGFVVFVVVAKLRKLVTDPVLDTAMSFVVPFGTYIAAEKIEAPPARAATP